MNWLRSVIYQPQINFLIRNTCKLFSTILPEGLKLPASGLVKINIDGISPFKLKTNQTSYITRQLFWNDPMAFEYTPIFKELVKKVRTFWDIGANIGYFTFLASSIVGEHGKVYSFEPFSENIKMLSINNMESKLDNINIYPFAVSNSDNLCLFDNSGSNGFIRPMSDKLSRVMDSTPVYSVALDRLLGNVDKVDFIKIDTEGAEYLALSGAKEILVKHTPTIVSEFSPEALLATSGVNYDEYLKLLLINEKYQLYAFEGDKLIPCGRDFDQLMAVFTRSNAEHIDIVASTNQPKS